jgi:hypothetical protein
MRNQYVTDGLRVKLAEIQAAIRASEQRIKELTSAKATITDALRIMGSDTGEGAVALGIQPGTFTRTILEVLRDADGPRCVREIAGKLAGRSERPLDKRQFNLVVARVRNVMPRLSDQLEGGITGPDDVLASAERIESRWYCKRLIIH